MNATELLNSRINQAHQTKGRDAEMPLKDRIPLLNSKLAELTRQQKVSEFGTVEMIFPAEDRPDDREFLFEVLTSKSAVEGLTATLKEHASPKERWNYEEWLQRASEDEKTIITVKHEGDDKPAGYAIIDAGLAIEDHAACATPRPTTYLTVSIDSVYVSPAERGNGHSQALSWAAGRYVDSIYHAVAQWTDPDRKYLEKLPFEIFIRGEAHSPGGARFMSRTVEEIECNLEMMEPDTTWHLIPILTDDCDFSDFPDEGFTLGR